MMDLMLSFDQQRTRFERHHKKISPIACDYTWADNGFSDVHINATFLGWMMAVQAHRDDEVKLSYTHNYGWRFEYLATGFSVTCPLFFYTYSTLDQAVEWGKEQGLVITEIED
jgi:hypothetical protein